MGNTRRSPPTGRDANKLRSLGQQGRRPRTRNGQYRIRPTWRCTPWALEPRHEATFRVRLRVKVLQRGLDRTMKCGVGVDHAP